jgi:phenylpropionate dioxygenase-like ring-hydroxylating dioxygenase large terminal subunit
MSALADDATVVQRILDHVDRGTTDLGETTWREPVAHYRSAERLEREIALVLRRHPTPFCPSAALPGPGSYLAREAAGTPLLAVRGDDGRVRVFRNACRHRGTLLASGSGCARAFSCGYHGWTYALDGCLRHVPHEHGFPGLDKASRGLVPVAAVERSGLVFATQERPASEPAPQGELPPLVAPGQRLLQASEREVPANWKILAEGFLEGYHIKATHPRTFYPLQYDNLNVVERFGANSRIAFPYQAVEKLRERPPAERRADGKLTYVYHLFPNAMLATFPGELRILVVLEPLAVDRTRFLTWVIANAEAEAAQADSARRGGELVDAGGAEDRAIACAIQRGIASGANEWFEFGRFEGAIGHFHRTLGAALDAADAATALDLAAAAQPG